MKTIPSFALACMLVFAPAVRAGDSVTCRLQGALISKPAISSTKATFNFKIDAAIALETTGRAHGEECDAMIGETGRVYLPLKLFPREDAKRIREYLKALAPGSRVSVILARGTVQGRIGDKTTEQTLEFWRLDDHSTP